MELLVDHILNHDEVLDIGNAQTTLSSSPLLLGILPDNKRISRAAWGARKPKIPPTRLSTATGNTGHYEGPKMGEYDHETCATRVRAIQNFHMDQRGWNDIAYSTITCRHGYIYECRGFGIRTAAQGTNEGNSKSYAHCVMIGQEDVFTDEAKASLRDVFLEYEALGSGTNKWSHLDWHATSCAGLDITTYIRAGLPEVSHTNPIPPEPTPVPVIDTFKEKVMALPVLRTGSTGQYVRNLQALLVVAARDLVGDANTFIDGQFGPNTERVLRIWQSRTTLQADGIAGPATWSWLVGV